MNPEDFLMDPSPVVVKFRDRQSACAEAFAAFFPDWDVQAGDIFSGAPADLIVSPANCTGRMDGGIDLAYVQRFGWHVEANLMRDIRAKFSGHLPIGTAHVVSTYDAEVPLLICAPTMAWPPGDVSGSDNAYFAFRAALIAARRVAQDWDRPVTLLTPGLCTLTGGMPPVVAAVQMRKAWLEFRTSDLNTSGNRADA